VFVSQVQLCYVATPDGKGCVAATYGSVKGAALSASGTGTYSNAQHCSQLGGPFPGGGGGIGRVSGSFVKGGCIWQANAGVSVGALVGGWGGTTYTWTQSSY
jgi:hypothetical protein